MGLLLFGWVCAPPPSPTKIGVAGLLVGSKALVSRVGSERFELFLERRVYLITES